MTEPHHPAEMEAEDAEEQEVLLADPDDYHRAQRLRTIHERRRQVHRVLDEISRFNHQNEHEKQKLDLADAICSYYTELQPLFDDAGIEIDMEGFPFSSVAEYAIRMGRLDKDGKRRVVHYEVSMAVFHKLNAAFSEIKPLIEPDESNEWDV